MKRTDGWSAELVIPFACLGETMPAPGDVWGLDLGREETPHREVVAWSPPGYHERKSDGDLVFE